MVERERPPSPKRFFRHGEKIPALAVLMTVPPSWIMSLKRSIERLRSVLPPPTSSGISINSTFWIPRGYANFIAEAKAAMRVVDGAIIVIGGNSGVKVNTETVWGYANEFQVPRVLYVCKMGYGAGPISCGWSKRVKKNISFAAAVPIQFPIGSEANFKGVVDLIQRKGLYLSGGWKRKIRTKGCPSGFEGKK